VILTCLGEACRTTLCAPSVTHLHYPNTVRYRCRDTSPKSFGFRGGWEGVYAKIKSMKPGLPHPYYASYKRHRKEVTWQVILPVLLTGIFIIGLTILVSIATFRDGGDVGRWAAISTIWLVIPIMIAGLILFILLIGIIYLLARLLHIAPTYTGLAQDYIHRGAHIIKKVADAAVQPIFFLEGFSANVKAFFGRK